MSDALTKLKQAHRILGETIAEMDGLERMDAVEQKRPLAAASRSPSMTCSFCGITQQQAQRLCSGQGHLICDGCVGLACDVFEEEGIHYRLTPPPTTTSSPATSLPEWRRELERLGRGFIQGSAFSPAPGELERFRALEQLELLRHVVEAGEGEADVPQVVIDRLCVWKLAPWRCLGSDQNRGKNMTALRDSGDHMRVVDTAHLLAAIDAAGAEACRKGGQS